MDGREDNQICNAPTERDRRDGIRHHVRQLLSLIEWEQDKREGLEDTPARVEKAYRKWFGGYTEDPVQILKVFEDGAAGYTEMIVRENIPVYSHCEHHMAPIIGWATVAYIPDGRIVGLSKLDRLVDCFARRLQVQERMTRQIANALWTHLNPAGVGVFIRARHMCIESRGVENASSETVTIDTYGALMDNTHWRSEFMALARQR